MIDRCQERFPEGETREIATNDLSSLTVVDLIHIWTGKLVGVVSKDLIKLFLTPAARLRPLVAV